MARVNSLAHKHKNDAEQINSEIIQQWIAGRGRHPVTWKTLTETLHDSELNTLAGDIEAVKLDGSLEEVKTGVVPNGGFEHDKLYTKVAELHNEVHLGEGIRTQYND